MIHPLADQGEGTPASFVARDFELDAVRGDETLVISALGLYRAFINGQRVGDDLLTPGWTCYDKRIAFQSYPVAGLLRPGANRIEIWLADGWYRSQIMWRREAIFNCWGDKIGALAEIVSGDAVLLRTDASWQSGALPILRSGIYFGEIYDARARRPPGDRRRRGAALRHRPARCPGMPAGARAGAVSGRGRAGPTARAGRSTTSARTPPATSRSRCAGRRARG